VSADRATVQSGVEAAPAKSDGRVARSGWATVRRALAILFVLGVLGLLVNHARSIDWSAVMAALRALPARTLLAAAGIALASYTVYCSYDLIGRRHTGHGLRPLQVVGVTFVSYAFNLNLGALVGGIAFRYRLYAGLGLSTGVTTQVLMLSLLTNWLGYLFLAGGLFLLHPIELPPHWRLGSGGLRILGAGLLLVAAAYVALCAASPRRVWRVRGLAIRLPSAGVALLQLALSSINWMLIGAVLHVLLQGAIDYPTVLTVLLVAAVAGVITHVPAGLGVLEAVFVALLSHRMPLGPLLAALLAYRALYYLAPLAAAAALFPLIDGRKRRRPA
jgi:uncharacterized membrane protein YbhN (UPF0104 family)